MCVRIPLPAIWYYSTVLQEVGDEGGSRDEALAKRVRGGAILWVLLDR